MNNKDYTEVLSQNDVALVAEELTELPVDAAAKDRMKLKIMGNINTSCPAGGITFRSNDSPWIEVTKNISVQVIHQDHENKVQTALWRLKPGTVVPGHYHNHDEDCLVLEGDISFEGHALYPGDFHRMEKDTQHPDMTTVSGALLYLKHDIHEDLSWLDV